MTPVNVCKGSIASCRVCDVGPGILYPVCQPPGIVWCPSHLPSPSAPHPPLPIPPWLPCSRRRVGLAWHPRGGGQGPVAASKIDVGCARRGHGLSRGPQVETSQAWACKSAVRLFLTPASHMPAQATGRRGVRGVSVQPPGPTRADGGRRGAKQGSRQSKQPVDSSRHSADSWESATRGPAGALGPNQEPRLARNRDDEQRGASTPPDLQLARKSAMLKQARIGNTQRAKHRASSDALRSGVQAWNRPNKRPCPGEASAEWGGWMALAGRAWFSGARGGKWGEVRQQGRARGAILVVRWWGWLASCLGRSRSVARVSGDRPELASTGMEWPLCKAVVDRSIFLWVRNRKRLASDRQWEDLAWQNARTSGARGRQGRHSGQQEPAAPWSQAPQCKGLAGNEQDASFRNTVDPARVRFPVLRSPKNHSHPMIPMIRIFNAAVMLPRRRPFHLHASPKAQPARPALPSKTTMPAGSVRDAVPSPPVVPPPWTSAGLAQRQLMSSRRGPHRLHAADCVGRRRRRLSRLRRRLPPPAIPPHGTFTCHTTLDECSVGRAPGPVNHDRRSLSESGRLKHRTPCLGASAIRPSLRPPITPPLHLASPPTPRPLR